MMSRSHSVEWGTAKNPAVMTSPVSVSTGAALGGKRVSRDPFSRAYKVNVDECPAMAELMVFCGPGYFQQRLPWDEPWDATA